MYGVKLSAILLVIATISSMNGKVLAASPRNGVSRIINGEDSALLPYQVKITGCGGSIINLNWVLTARHCVNSGHTSAIEDNTPISTTAYAGISDLKDPNRETRNIPASSVILHESADLALLRINPPFEESDNIQPIQINDVYENLKGQYVKISGWGHTTEEESPTQLQATSIKVTGQGDGLLYMNMDSTQQGACHGDSGGPAVLEDNTRKLLVGVTHGGNGTDFDVPWSDFRKLCGPGINNGLGHDYPTSVYVDVFRYADWIKNNVEMNSVLSEPNPCGCCNFRIVSCRAKCHCLSVEEYCEKRPEPMAYELCL